MLTKLEHMPVWPFMGLEGQTNKLKNHFLHIYTTDIQYIVPWVMTVNVIYTFILSSIIFSQKWKAMLIEQAQAKPNFWILDPYGFVSSGTCETNGMKSIVDQTSCKSAGTWFRKLTNNFFVHTRFFGNRKPKGCSWHQSGNVEFWTSSSGDCDNNYHGCFCNKIQGKESLIF